MEDQIELTLFTIHEHQYGNLSSLPQHLEHHLESSQLR